MTLPTGLELQKVIKSFAETEWITGNRITSEEFGRFPSQNNITTPHYFGFRYRIFNEELDQAIIEAVESFKGSVEWLILVREDKKNRVIVTKKVKEYEKLGKRYTTEKDRLGRADDYIATYEPEWGRMANMDVPKLAEHIRQYVTQKMGGKLPIK